MALRQSLIHPSHDCSLIRLKARLVKMLGFVGSFRILWAACNQLVPVDYENDGHTRWYIRPPRPCSYQLGNIWVSCQHGNRLAARKDAHLLPSSLKATALLAIVVYTLDVAFMRCGKISGRLSARRRASKKRGLNPYR